MENRPAELVTAGPLCLRRVELRDAPALQALVADGIDHVVPWMPWASREPLSLDQRRAEIGRWAAEWDANSAWDYGIWLDLDLVGLCGLYRRSPTEVSLGYWIGARHVGHGYATWAASRLTSAGFVLDGVVVAVIRHDAANAASRRIAEKLHYRKVAEEPHTLDAPGQTGCSWVWEMTRQEWTARVLPAGVRKKTRTETGSVTPDLGQVSGPTTV